MVIGAGYCGLIVPDYGHPVNQVLRLVLGLQALDGGDGVVAHLLGCERGEAAEGLVEKPLGSRERRQIVFVAQRPPLKTQQVANPATNSQKASQPLRHSTSLLLRQDAVVALNSACNLASLAALPSCMVFHSAVVVISQRQTN